MPYVWLSGYSNETVNGMVGQNFPITSVSSNERLVRTIVHWRVEVFSSQSGTVAQWYNAGVVSLIEWTEGDPPPTPAAINTDTWDQRDILYSALEFPGPGGIFTGSDAVPADGRPGVVDTSVSRDPGELAGIVWWSWGLPNVTVPGINVGFPRIWWRVLVEQDP